MGLNLKKYFCLNDQVFFLRNNYFKAKAILQVGIGRFIKNRNEPTYFLVFQVGNAGAYLKPKPK